MCGHGYNGAANMSGISKSFSARIHAHNGTLSLCTAKHTSESGPGGGLEVKQALCHVFACFIEKLIAQSAMLPW